MRIDDRTCFTMARKLSRMEGIFSGGSSGAAVWAALEYARREKLGPDAVVVTIIVDHGLRYLSKVYSEQWLRENSMLESEFTVSIEELLGTKETGLPLLVSVDSGSTAADALKIMKEHAVSQVPVIDGGEPTGALQEAELVELIVSHRDPREVKVGEIMEEPFPVISADAPLEDAARLLTRDNPAVLVRDAQGGLGIVTKYDLIQQIAR
jgi:cystathionine beta-synthase